MGGAVVDSVVTWTPTNRNKGFVQEGTGSYWEELGARSAENRRAQPTRLLFDGRDAPRGEGSGLLCVTGPGPPVPALLPANPLWPEVPALPPNCYGGRSGGRISETSQSPTSCFFTIFCRLFRNAYWSRNTHWLKRQLRSVETKTGYAFGCSPLSVQLSPARSNPQENCADPFTAELRMA